MSSKAKKTLFLACLSLFVMSGNVLANDSDLTVGQSTSRSAKDVLGKVVDETGQPIIGATVAMTNGKGGTITDGDGNFSFSVPNDAKTVRVNVSYVGMEPQVVVLTPGKSTTITLAENSQLLSDVVVIGYGTEKKKNIAGAVSNVRADELAKSSVESIQKALQGKVSGVQILTADGAPGAGMTINVRGRSTISGGSKPLYIIDGVQVVTGDQSSGILKSTDVLSTLNPDEIESIDILKDGASASIYGAQAANGVIIITTKKGHEGKPQLQVKVTGGIQEISNKVDRLNTQQLVQLDLLAFSNRYGQNSTEYANRLKEYQGYGWGDDGYSKAPTYDWYDLIFRKAYSLDAQASVTGGNSQTKYFISAAYNGTDGIVRETGFNRGAFRINLTQEIKPWLTFTTNNNYSVMKQDQYSTVRAANPNRVALLGYPANYPYDENGNFVQSLPYGYYQHNSLQMLHTNEYTGTTTKLISANALDFKIYSDLSFKSSYNIDVTNTDEHGFIDPRTREGSKANGTISEMSDRIVNFQTEQVFNYQHKFDENNRITAVAGFSYRHQHDTYHGATGTGVSDPSLHLLNSAAVAMSVSGSFSEWKMASLFGRVNYNYADKYILTGVIRRDGSSRFGANNKWGWFPSVSAAWRIVEEDFMKDVSWLSDLKLRMSYGVTGNSEIGNYAARRWYSSSGSYDNTAAIIPYEVGNPYLTWEKNQSRNIGITAGFLQDRINIELDAYINDTKDLLYYRTIPATTGFTSIPSNMGGVRNKGLEALLNTVNVQTKNFEWRTSFNISYNQNRITELQDGLDEMSGYKVGKPISSIHTYKWAGVNSADGRPMYYDKDGYIVYSPTVDDRIWTKPTEAPIFGGLNNEFSYKGLNLSIFFTFQRGAVALWSDKLVLTAYDGDTNLLNAMYFEHWANPGDVTWIPKPSYQASYPGNPRSIAEYSTFCYEKTDYIKLKNINLSYNLPKKWLKPMHLNNMQIFATANNLWCTTCYPGQDPEFTGSDVGTYPQSRSYSIGFKLDF